MPIGEMLYTPTPGARRPRPPGSRSHRKPAAAVSKKNPTSIAGDGYNVSSASSLDPSLIPSHVSSSSSQSAAPQTPASAYALKKQRMARSELSRISATPGDVGEVSMGLDVELEDTTSSGGVKASLESRHTIGLGLPTRLSLAAVSSLVASTEIQPSPPPPYGQELPDTTPPAEASQSRTPPRQDSGFISSTTPQTPEHNLSERASTEERLRARRATDAARAMGLDMDFGGADGVEAQEESEEELDEVEVRMRLREVKKRLKQRDNELLMAAKVADKALRSHEAVIALLPPSTKSRIPHLVSLVQSRSRTHSRNTSTASASASSSPRPSHMRNSSLASASIISPTLASSPADNPIRLPFRGGTPIMSSGESSSSDLSRLVRTMAVEDPGLPFPMHERKVSRPKIFGHPTGIRNFSVSSPPHAHWSALQQAEQDDRIFALEQALAEARDGEEAQRKLASRLRKEFDKLQRELERAEERMADLSVEKVLGIGTPRNAAVWRQKKTGLAEDLRSNRVRNRDSDFDMDKENRLGWGATTFPEFPAGTSGLPAMPTYAEQQEEPMGENMAGLARDSMDTLRAKVSHASLSGAELRLTEIGNLRSSLGVQSVDDVDSSSSASISPSSRAKPRSRTKSLTRRSTRLPLALAGNRRMQQGLSRGSFLSPPKPLAPVSPDRDEGKSHSTPHLRFESPRSGRCSPAKNSTGSLRRSTGGRSASASYRSPSPFPRLSSNSPFPFPDGSPAPRLSVSPAPNLSPSPSRRHRTLSSHSLSMRSVSYRSLSPMLSTLTSRMAFMRTFVADNIQRTLGSELGSEFGDDWRSETDRGRLSTFTSGSRDASSAGPGGADLDVNGKIGDQLNDDIHDDNEWTDEEADVFQPYTDPAPLPPRVSAALSSLAIALAPASVFAPPQDSSVPILPRGSLREPGLDAAAYDLLSEAVRMRKIRWADGSPANSSSSCGSAKKARTNGRSTLGSRVSTFAPPMHWMPEDPWEAEDYPDELSDGSTGIRPSRRRLVHRNVSGTSGSSIALAHRRVNSISISQPLPDPSVQLSRAVIGKTALTKVDVVGWQTEPKTIPAKLVHDVCVYIRIMLEWIECTVIVLLKMLLDVRYRHRRTFGMRRTALRRRYYL